MTIRHPTTDPTPTATERTDEMHPFTNRRRHRTTPTAPAPAAAGAGTARPIRPGGAAAGAVGPRRSVAVGDTLTVGRRAPSARCVPALTVGGAAAGLFTASATGFAASAWGASPRVAFTVPAVLGLALAVAESNTDARTRATLWWAHQRRRRDRDVYSAPAPRLGVGTAGAAGTSGASR